MPKGLNYLLFLLGFLLQLPLPAFSAETPVAPQVRIVISVDWEGMHLTEENLKAMRDFRLRNPNVRFVHFLNAAYFTRPNTDLEAVRKQIASVVLPGDELGLHIHGWKSLFEAAGLKYKKGPTYDGPNDLGETAAAIAFADRGHNVPISHYSETQLRKVIRKSLEILKEHGFEDIKSFRAGGWLGGPNVLAALAAEGIHIDSSGLPADLEYDQTVEAVKNTRTLQELAAKAQPNTKVTTQPYEIKTSHGVIREFPNNGGMADYVSKDGLLKMFHQNYVEMLRTRATGMYFNMGFHQESAAKNLGKIEAALHAITKFVDSRKNISVHSVGLSESVNHPLATGEVLDCRTLWESIRG